MKNVKIIFGIFLLFQTVLTGCSSEDSNPTTPDPIEQNGKILFEATVGNSDHIHLFVMNTDGSNGVQLTNFVNENVGGYTHSSDAFWSPNGSKIVFQTNKDNDGGSRIYIMNADGSNVTRINHNLGRIEMNPTFSPDGNRILFEATEWNSDNIHLFVMNTDGSNGIQLTNFVNENMGGYTHSSNASWSPDGSKIVFQSNKDNDGGSRIYIMNADGSNVTRINHNLGRIEMNPTFSPDGNRILFEATEWNSDNIHLFVMNTDGSNGIQLTNFVNENMGGYTHSSDASWNPDGSKIVFQTNKDNDGGSRIYIMNADGSAVTRVSHNLGRLEEKPVWK